MDDNTYFCTIMVKMCHANGIVSCACHSTSNTLLPALQSVKTKPGT